MKMGFLPVMNTTIKNSDYYYQEVIMLKKIILNILLAVLGVLILTGCKNNDNKLYSSAKAYIDKNCDNGSANVILSDLTDFDWERALVFEYPTTQKEIEDAIGIKYTKSLDLVSGIIFVKEGKIVYDETFSKDFDGKSEFFVYANIGSTNRPKLKVFGSGAVFKCGKEKSKQYGYHYWLESIDP
jgi:uncharacterized lipoprotein NlpE involved in copper resistance